MSDKPIIFSGPMVRAILDGRKIQTRRVLKPQPIFDGSLWHLMAPGFDGGAHGIYDSDVEMLAEKNIWWRKQLHAPGDRLWVREAWNITHRQHLAPGEDIERSAEDCVAANGGFACACADGVVYQATAAQSHPEYGKALWRPSTHMPRWASRLTLIVENVRVQRLQEIVYSDTLAEGIECTDIWKRREAACIERNEGCGSVCRDSFRDLWNSLNAKRGYGWDANPWVVALTFRAIKKNIDEVQDDG